jgi:hypothetical protein
MQVIVEHAFEFLVGGFSAVLGYFGKRTLNQYDRRIRDTEIKQDIILSSISKIDKEVVHISTVLEIMKGNGK